MKPTILEGDRVFVNKLAYDLKVPFTTWHIAEWSNPQRGDIVVFYSPKDGQRLVKRVIGLPGDTVESRDDQLVINSQPLEYSPPDPEIPAQLPKPERERSTFATEKLVARPHAVTHHGIQMRLGQCWCTAGRTDFMMGDSVRRATSFSVAKVLRSRSGLGSCAGISGSGGEYSKGWLLMTS